MSILFSIEPDVLCLAHFYFPLIFHVTCPFLVVFLFVGMDFSAIPVKGLNGKIVWPKAPDLDTSASESPYPKKINIEHTRGQR